MTYYFVANYDVNDREMYGQYMNEVGATLMKYGGKPLIVDHHPNNLEGEVARSLIVIEFESEEAHNNWYNSVEYQKIVNLRIEASTGWARGAPEFVMPS